MRLDFYHFFTALTLTDNVMSKLQQDFHNLSLRNRDGSFATQANRRAMLNMFSDQLGRSGFKIRADELKGRHVNALLRVWRAEGVTDATIKNRMAVVRWWAEKVGNPGAVKSNQEYGIGDRIYATNQDKSLTLSDINFSKLDPYVGQSLKLQDAFGLRREESMKFQPIYALQGQSIDEAKEIRIKNSWAKGGRERTIPITNERQRDVLRSAYQLVGHGSLIPSDKTYKSHLVLFEFQTRENGIGRTHGLRHNYAQSRYRELMGFDCPAKGGKKLLDPEEKLKDQAVRLQISQELGHNRINITTIYLGSAGNGR